MKYVLNSKEHSNPDVVIVRAPEHNYEYLQWHEDVNAAYLLSVFLKAGYDAEVYDYALRSSPLEFNPEELLKKRASLIIWVVDKHPTNNPFHVSEMIRKFSAIASSEKPHLSIYGNTQVGPERFLRELPIDSVILGEEHDALSLVRCIIEGNDLPSTTGTMFKASDGKLHATPVAPRPNLDDLPWPARYYFHDSRLSQNPKDYVGAIMASRGCYAKCTFCYIRSKEETHGEYSWQGRAPEDVVDEMSFLYFTHGVREFAFVDPQFFGPGKRGHQWALRIADLILQNGLKDIAFSIYARANDIRQDSIMKLKEAGLYAVFIGVESFSQDVLNRYRKGVTVERNVEAIELLMQHNIRLRMGFITFDRNSTFDELEQSAIELERLCALRGDLITQPVFFNNSLTALENTPSSALVDVTEGNDQEVRNAAPLLYEYRRKLSRGNGSTTNPDVRVEVLAEATRMLAAELTQRSIQLEAQLSKDGNETRPAQTEETMAWFDGLTPFAVSTFTKLIGDVKSRKLVKIGAEVDRLAEWIGTECKTYDSLHLAGRQLEVASSRTISMD
ncbi:B12-binding domain-containing radical SAM protein [Dinoroseobacter sp. S76]|uniref:B12-binding domain-containing radical SAM protein n=1 Tax=Dinoroseobacter sp. S76 TaxID=3415124 RepID=UPI003C7C5EC6